MRIGLDAWRAWVRFCNGHFQAVMCEKKVTIISDTSAKICLHFKMMSIYISYELIHAFSCPPRTPTPPASLLSFLKTACSLSNLSNFPSGAGQASVSIYSGSAMRNVICATVGKRVGCAFKYGGFGRVRVCKIRPMQDSAVKYRLMLYANFLQVSLPPKFPERITEHRCPWW